MTSKTPQPKTATEPTIRLVAFFTLFVTGTDTFLTAPLLPLLQREFHIDAALAGWLVSAYALGYALCALVAGPLSDRLDRRYVLLAGLLGFIVFTAACGLTWDFWSLFTARFLAGVSTAFVGPQIWATIPITVPGPAIIKTMGYATAGLAIAQVVGVPVGSFLSYAGWHLPFFVIAACAALLWLLLYARFPNVLPLTNAGGSLFAPYRQVLGSGPLVLSLSAYLLFQMGGFGAFSFIASWLARDFGANQLGIGIIMVILGIGNALGSFAGPKLVARIGSRRSHFWGIAAVGALYLSTAFIHNLPVAVIIFTLALFSAGFAIPVLMGELQSHTEHARGTVASLSNASMYAGLTIAGGIGGRLLDSFPGYSGIAVFTAVTLAASLGLYALGGAFKTPQTRG